MTEVGPPREVSSCLVSLNLDYYPLSMNFIRLWGEKDTVTSLV